MRPNRDRLFARVLAPLAFLLAATAAVLVARSALAPAEPASPAATAPARAAAASPPTATTTAPAPPATTAAAAEPAFHVVRAGDTLAAIAEEYGTTVEAIAELNPGIDPVALTIGQRVRVG